MFLAPDLTSRCYIWSTVVISLALSNCMTVGYVFEEGMPLWASLLHCHAVCEALTSIYGLIKDREYERLYDLT